MTARPTFFARATSFVFAATVTLAMLGGIDGLASRDLPAQGPGWAGETRVSPQG
jgi:hypothetical protein